ncbi:MAG: AbrB/MazE/SpoVT family DNA-binding domain-containing protein [Armatimonadetes bacterium]|nr:AbrB/MazE/SpoVT family DNA-binding domain-containing protein [Armatimonadota bacterium]
MTITKLVKLSRKGQLVLPKKMREEFGVGEGDEVVATLEENCIVLTTSERYAQATRGLLIGAWGRNKTEVSSYIEKEREAWQ